MIDEGNGCYNCGARLANGICNNVNSSKYKQVATTKCNAQIKRVFTPKEWGRMRK